MYRCYRSIIAICLFCLSAALYSEEINKEEVKTFALNPGGSVILKADEGDVVVNTWSKPEIRIRMIKRAWGRSKREAARNMEKIRVDISPFKNRIIIQEKKWEGESSFLSIFRVRYNRYGQRVDFELTVPKKTNLKIECDEGDVRISNVEGKIKVETDEGDLNLDEIVSDLIQLQADEGSVNCSKIESRGKGYLKADVDEGNFNLDDSKVHEIDVNCDEGRIFIEETITDRFRLYCDEGSITVSFIPSDEGDYEIGADEGNISIRIPEECNLKLVLRSEEGKIINDFGLSKSKMDDGELLRGVIGRSSALLRARTDEGDIRVMKNN